MPDYNSIKIITDNDYCISCGACTHICPFDNIVLEYSLYRGKWDAIVQNTEKCITCDGLKNCLAVCPSYNVDYMSLASSHENNLLGKIANVYNGYSADHTIRFNASSGGFIRALCKSLLEKNEIDGIITITHDEELEYTPKIVTDVSSMPNSIYHNINYENAFKLLQETRGKYLLIGLPCQITSIEQLLRKKRFAYLKERIYAKVALICGYTFDRTNAEAFAFCSGFTLQEITYREKGRYRKTNLIHDKGSKLFDIKKPNGVFEYAHNLMMFDKFTAQNHCLYCVDHIGYCADIVVGDAWQKKYEADTIGTNLVISRTEQGEKIIAKVDGFVFEQGYKNEIIESQSEAYALGSLGESMKTMRYKDKYFYPLHKRTDNTADIKTYPLRSIDIFKMAFLKKLLRNRKFLLAKYLYVLLHYKHLLKFVAKNIFGHLR